MARYEDPDGLLDWGTDAAADVVEPPLAKKLLGFLDREKPPNGWLNWLLGRSGQWLRDFYETLPVEFSSVAIAIERAQDWQTVRVIETTAGAAPGAQVAASPSSINLGATSQVAGAATDGRYFYAIDQLVVRRWDLVDGTDTGTTYAPGWAAGTIEQVGTTGRSLVLVGNDTGASERKATLIDLSDASTVATVTIASSLAGGAARHVRVGHTYAWVARTSDGTDTHDCTRITLATGAATDLTLLSYSSTDAPVGFDVDDDHVYVGDALNHEVLVYDGTGSTLLATCAASDGTYNLRALRCTGGQIFALFETTGGALVLAHFDNRGQRLAELEVSATLTDHMLALDDQYVYVLVGDGAGSAASIELRAWRVGDLSAAWRRLGTFPATSTDYEGMWADGMHLWADTTSASNPQIRRLHTTHRRRMLTKIPGAERGQERGMLMTGGAL